MKHSGRQSYGGGSQRNECASPPYSIIPLIPHLDYFIYRRFGLKGKRKDLVLWECATGPEGDMTGLSEGLRAIGYTVVESNSDFMKAPTVDITAIHGVVTNPPYDSATKQAFVNRCEYYVKYHNMFWCLLTTPLTVTEKRIKPIITGPPGVTVIHPWGRIPFGMPMKKWGTRENPTTPTFNTAWLTKYLTDDPKPAIYYDDTFELSGNHFKNMDKWKEYLARIK